MSWLWQDIRFGLRTISKDRGFFLTAVLALALGIGSTTSIFSVIYNVLIDPFPYADGQHLLALQIRETGTSRINARLPISEFLDFQQQSHIFRDSIGVYEEIVLLREAGQTKEFDADRLTSNAFQFLGMRALLGRGLLPRDAVPGAPPVFVLNYRVWKQDFGLDPSVIGKTFNLDGTPTTLVGVMPPRFAFWDGNLWRPIQLDRADKEHRLVMYGHLRPGLTDKAAEAELQPLAIRLAKSYPNEFPKRFSVHLLNLIDDTVGSFKSALYTLLAAVSTLLLIACTNVSNLLLARTTARERELAIRISLGSGRLRVIRQLLVESILLALTGAGVGCLFAWAGLKGLMTLLPMWTFPDEAVIDENVPVLLATIGVAVLAGVLFGLAPALAASKRDVNESLKAGGRGNSGFRSRRLRNALVVSEVALSLLLLTSSGLLMRSFLLQRQTDLGIKSDHVLTTRVNLPAKQYKTVDSQVRFLRDVLQRVNAYPGVSGAAVMTDLTPYAGLSTDIEIAGVTHSERWSAYIAPCSWQIFRTLRAHLQSGRLLTEADEAGKRKVIVINQALASKYFRGRNPVGQRIELTVMKTETEPLADPRFEVIGIISDIKNEGSRKDTSPEAYIPYTIEGYGGYIVYVRSVANPEALVPGLTNAVLTADPAVIPQTTWTLERTIELSEYAQPRFAMILLAVFAAVGLALVSFGVYSVIFYTVSQQRHDIGIRMALGATQGAIQSHVITASLRFVGAGVALGLILTVLASRLLTSLVWGIPWNDPLTLGIVAALLIVVGAAAAYIPSVRAARTNPAILLRNQ